MFTANKFHKWYLELTSRAQRRHLDPGTYTERHHIIPRSLGGSNEPVNLARLTAREHYVAHWLLTKFTEGQDKKKMVLALFAMTRSSKNQQRVACGARQYARVREAVSEALTGAGNPRFGVEVSEETRAKLSAAWERREPVQHTEATKQKIGDALRGKPRPEWLKEQWSRTRKGRPGQDNNSGKAWWNNGEKSVLAHECPPGFVRGRLAKQRADR